MFQCDPASPRWALLCPSLSQYDPTDPSLLQRGSSLSQFSPRVSQYNPDAPSSGPDGSLWVPVCPSMTQRHPDLPRGIPACPNRLQRVAVCPSPLPVRPSLSQFVPASDTAAPRCLATPRPAPPRCQSTAPPNQRARQGAVRRGGACADRQGHGPIERAGGRAPRQRRPMSVAEALQERGGRPRTAPQSRGGGGGGGEDGGGGRRRLALPHRSPHRRAP